MSELPEGFTKQPEQVLQNFFETVRKTGQAWTFSQAPGQYHVYERGENKDGAACPLWSTREKANEHLQYHDNCELVALSIDFLSQKMLADFDRMNIMVGIDWNTTGGELDAPAGGVIEIITSDHPYVRVTKTA